MRYKVDPALKLYRQIPEDEHTRSMAASVGSVVYRFFGDGDEVLYVGMTARPRERWYAHSRTASWWPLVRAIEVSPERLTEHEARLAEWDAIAESSPRFNIAKRPSLPTSSLSDHGGLTEGSRNTQVRKGREGKGDRKGSTSLTSACSNQIQDCSGNSPLRAPSRLDLEHHRA